MNGSNFRFSEPPASDTDRSAIASDSEFQNTSTAPQLSKDGRNTDSPFSTLDGNDLEREESLQDFLNGLTVEERNAFFTKLTERFGERLDEILALIEELNDSCAKIAQTGTGSDRTDPPFATDSNFNTASFAENTERSAICSVPPCASDDPETAPAPAADECRTDRHNAPSSTPIFQDIQARPISDDLFCAELQALSAACEELQAYYRSKGLCPSCGGKFRGIFHRTCRQCGRPKKHARQKSPKTEP